MTIDGARWTCTLADYACRTPDVPPPGEIRRGISGPVRGDISSASPRPRMSPDGKWMAFIDNYNVAIRPFGGDKRTALSTDGSEGNYYDGASIAWSPDSTEGRRLSRAPWLSPSRALRVVVAGGSAAARALGGRSMRSLAISSISSSRCCSTSAARSSSRSTRSCSRIRSTCRSSCGAKTAAPSRSNTTSAATRSTASIEVDAQTGVARAVISEEPKTFFYYNRSAATLQAGKRYRYDLADGKEIVWMSERDGWNHLYLIDGATGAVKKQITKGAWPVRHVIKVDEEKRQIWFSAGGMNAGEGSVLPALLPHQPRRHRPDAADLGRRAITPSSSRPT